LGFGFADVSLANKVVIYQPIQFLPVR